MGIAMRLCCFIVTGCLLAIIGCTNSGNSPNGKPDGKPGDGAKPIDSLAILPFTGQMTKPDIATAETWPATVRNLLEDILPDLLTTDVVEQAPPHSMKVIATEVVRERKLTGKPAQQSGAELKVGAVLAGKLADDGQLSMQLLSVESGELLWGKTYSLSFGFSKDHGTWRLSMSDADRTEIVRNVIFKLTGKEPAPAPSTNKER